jgi:hypothetical protein
LEPKGAKVLEERIAIALFVRKCFLWKYLGIEISNFTETAVGIV